MLTTLITILHVLVCLFLILVILLQPGTEGGIAMGAGGSQTAFGGGGQVTFLQRVTRYSAAAFFVTSLCLSFASSQGGSVTDLVEAPAAPAPTAPAAAPVAPTPAPAAPAPAPAATP